MTRVILIIDANLDHHKGTHPKSSTNLPAVIPQYSVALGGRGFSQRYHLNNPWGITLHAVTYLVILLLARNEGLNEHIVPHLMKDVTHSLDKNLGCHATLGRSIHCAMALTIRYMLLLCSLQFGL